jgi:signal transduction histidine kinase
MRPSLRLARHAVWLLLPLMLSTPRGAAAQQADRQKKVLVLYAPRRDAQIVLIGDRQLPRILEDGVTQTIDYYSEFLEPGRFFHAAYEPALVDFLRVKYADAQFDVVIAMGDVPYEFLLKHRAALFPQTPVVFFANRPVARLPNSTGVLTPLNFHGTLSLATALQPDLRHVYVISGASDNNRGYEALAREQFRPFEPRLEITYLSGLPTRELQRRIASLPKQSMIYYLTVDRDGANEAFHPLEYLNHLTAVANAPIYCWVDSAIDRGVVGGSLKDQTVQTQVVGELAVRVLRGEAADSIGLTAPDLNVSQVDWRQLRRWGVSEARVPAGTVIKFREPSAWDRYRGYILGTIALVLAQSALIGGLLLQRERRRHAERRMRKSEAELRTSYERIRDLGGRLLSAQESERSRIARELHDDISQQLALLTMDLELLNGASPQVPSTNAAGEALDRAHGIARSLHDLSHRLHPAKLRLIGLVHALQALLRESRRDDLRLVFDHHDVPSVLPPDLTLCLFRIVQEALQNALKYSSAKSVAVSLRASSEHIELTIEDDGIGFDVGAAWGKGLGLISMNERLEAVHGTLRIESRPGHGTRLEVIAPLPSAPAESLAG